MLEKIIERLENFAKAKHVKPCIIIYNGEQLKLPSGKVAWRNKGDAKSALTNALQNQLPYNERREFQKQEGYTSISTYLEEKGIVKFVTFDKDLYYENEFLKSKLEQYENIDSSVKGNPELENALHDAIEELGMTGKVYEIIYRDYPMGGDVEL